MTFWFVKTLKHLLDTCHLFGVSVFFVGGLVVAESKLRVSVADCAVCGVNSFSRPRFFFLTYRAFFEHFVFLLILILFFSEMKIEDLRRMYDLFSRVPTTLDELRRSMCEYVKTTGKALVTDQVRDTTYDNTLYEHLQLRLFLPF